MNLVSLLNPRSSKRGLTTELAYGGQGRRQSEYRQSEVENIDTEVRLMRAGAGCRYVTSDMGDLERV